MSIPRCYLTKTNNFEIMMDTIIAADIPHYFDTNYLKFLGFSDSNDKNIVTLFKSLGLLHGNNVPTKNYFKLRDPQYGKAYLAKLIRESYSDIFHKCEDAQNLSAREAMDLFRQLCPKDSMRTIEQKGRTFRYLCRYANWEIALSSVPVIESHMQDIHTFTGLIDYSIPHLFKFYEKHMVKNNLGSFDNEQRLQIILNEHLKSMFSSTIREKYMETGYSFRKPDFFIPELNMSFEVKHTGSISGSTALGDQIAADITHYTSQYIFFFIYDKKGIVKDPEFFKTQYENYSNEEKIIHVTIIK